MLSALLFMHEVAYLFLLIRDNVQELICLDLD